jgi:hypothetical protein
MSFKKMHHLLDKGAKFPQTLEHHSKFQNVFFVYIIVHLSKIMIFLENMCGKSRFFFQHYCFLERDVIF